MKRPSEALADLHAAVGSSLDHLDAEQVVAERRSTRPIRLPPYTCPSLDHLASLIEEYVPEPERTDALILIESVRWAHVHLRHVAQREDTKRAARAVAHLSERIESTIAALAARRTG